MLMIMMYSFFANGQLVRRLGYASTEANEKLLG
jgi:hypothetical protein